ncbi:hypothetical protein [Kitasatospora sp. NPDC050543]|uniref:hypothetical protein n=1 Tax=Kitasatospora sp. NPDC050543 TaxID=3364054 RepID=UPI00378C3F10
MTDYLFVSDPCEDCGAAAGVLCFTDCPTGPTWEDIHGQREQEPGWNEDSRPPA